YSSPAAASSLRDRIGSGARSDTSTGTIFQDSKVCRERVCAPSSSRPLKISQKISSRTCSHSRWRLGPTKKWRGCMTSAARRRTASKSDMPHPHPAPRLRFAELLVGEVEKDFPVFPRHGVFARADKVTEPAIEQFARLRPLFGLQTTHSQEAVDRVSR